ncbi:MAG TPA: hypothetical protein DC001_00795 [Clostridiales bacterium]|jgi:hypothetical protein|nr:hypothetical protein [Clostridiales bacterium]HBR08154.1 hypothetical protein [Clostridiales bacterium]
MKKTLYSLMLDDEVIREVDMLAHSAGTNRSNLINQILAEYVSITTPERRINDIFSAIESLMSPSREFVPFFAPSGMTMSLKSSLEYKYRPTVKYEVELYRSANGSLGELSVVFRTQSAALIREMTAFFRLWKRIEDKYLSLRFAGPIDYALYDGKFVRSIGIPPEHDCTTEEIATALSDYIKLFDSLLKDFLCGRVSASEVEKEYAASMEGREILI